MDARRTSRRPLDASEFRQVEPSAGRPHRALERHGVGTRAVRHQGRDLVSGLPQHARRRRLHRQDRVTRARLASRMGSGRFPVLPRAARALQVQQRERHLPRPHAGGAGTRPGEGAEQRLHRDQRRRRRERHPSHRQTHCRDAHGRPGARPRVRNVHASVAHAHAEGLQGGRERAARVPCRRRGPQDARRPAAQRVRGTRCLRRVGARTGEDRGFGRGADGRRRGGAARHALRPLQRLDAESRKRRGTPCGPVPLRRARADGCGGKIARAEGHDVRAAL